MQGIIRHILFALLFALAVTGSMTKPAHASWGVTGDDGCKHACASPQAVCDYWGNFYHGNCVSIDGLAYNAVGQATGWNYTYYDADAHHNLSGVPIPFCTPPLVDDVFSPVGCSQFNPRPPKQLGQSCPGSANCGDPFNVATGNLFETRTDFETVGAESLAFIRYYNSQSERTSSLGIRWRSNFDSNLDFRGSSASSTEEIAVVRPDGAEYPFNKFSGSWVSSDTDVDGTLATDGSTQWTFTDRDDVTYIYDFNTGKLLSIKNRSGYQQNLTYDSNGNLSTVTDSFSRTLTFGFVNGVVHTLTDADSNVFTFDYTALVSTAPNLLNKVTYPGTTTPFVQYVYENSTYPFALTGIIDEDGARYATWSYDASMRTASSSLAGGADSTTASYSLNSDGSGSVTVTNALGKIFVYTLSLTTGVGKITRIDEQGSSNTEAATVYLSYDTNGYLASRTDENSSVTNYQNNSRGEITKETDGAGSPVERIINTNWDPIYRLPDQIDEPNLLRTNFSYPGGLLTTFTQTDETLQTSPYSTNGEQRIWQLTYWPSGLLKTVDGPLSGTGDTVAFAYNANGFVSSITDELLHVTQITAWNARGEPLTVIDPNNITTTFTYDALGRITSATTNPGANQALTSFTYDKAGNVKTATAPSGLTLTYTYDDAHRLTKISNNLAESVNFTLDAMADRTQVQVKTGPGTVVKSQTAMFDELARVLKDIGAATQTTQHVYDKVGNEITTIDPRSFPYGHAFDALNRLYQETDPDMYHITAAYNAKDEITSITDPRLLATGYVRDGFGDIIQEASSDTGTTIYYYDELSNVTKKVDSRSVETDYTYDVKGRIKTRKIHGTTAENVTFTYDTGTHGINKLKKIVDPSGSTTFSYDALGGVSTEVRVIQTSTYNTSFVNDPAGHPLTITYPSGRIVTYTRDVTGRISGITTKQNSGASAVTIASNVKYLPFGTVTGLNFGNGVVLSLTYDQDYQLRGLTAASGSTSIQNLTYGYDPADNISPITDNLNSARNQTFGYDHVNRINGANGIYGVQTYAYDGTGNRTSRTVGSVTDTYAISPTSNQINTITTGSNVRSFSYLPTGQVSTDTRDPSHAYVYNYNNVGRLSSATLNGSTAGTYLVNGAEQRVAKTTGSSTTHFIFDRLGHLLAEANGTGVTQREYIWLDDLPVAVVDDTGASPVIYFIHTDHLGTPQKITDASANVVWDGVFDPFGIPFSITTTVNLTNNLRFPGQYFDVETGLAQNWNRDYDSSIGRYIESDPIGLDGGVNTYAYVDGNPLRRTDHDGRGVVGCVIGGGIGVLLGAAGGTAVEPGGGTIVGGFGGAAEGCDIGSGIETAIQIMQLANDLSKSTKIKCLSKNSNSDNDDHCEQLLKIDTDTCNGVTKLRGPIKGRICHESASERYAACLRGKPLPPLAVWNN
jgi:RHS repeat-associated protein